MSKIFVIRIGGNFTSMKMDDWYSDYCRNYSARKYFIPISQQNYKIKRFAFKIFIKFFNAYTYGVGNCTFPSFILISIFLKCEFYLLLYN